MPGGPKKKRLRRVKGTGSRFWNEARQCYMGRVVIGRLPSGGPKYATRTAKTETELERKLSLVAPPGDATTVATWLTRWLKEMKCKPGTRRSRTSAVTHHLGPSLGHLKVADLTPRQVEVAATEWKQMKRGQLVPLAPTSARMIMGVLGTAMRAAVRARLRPDNPVNVALKPKGKAKKIDPFDRTEVQRIATEALNRPGTRAVALIAATGMRSGEVMALDVADWNDATEEVSITKTLDTSDRDLLGTPKSDNSERVIRVPGEPPEAIEAVRAAIGARRTGPVFRTASGRRTVYKVLSSAWTALLRRLSIRYRGMHQLRHSWASHALAACVDVAEVAKYLGNTVAEVHKTYAHATRATDPVAAMERFFRGGYGDNRVTPEPENGAKRLKTKRVTQK